MRRVHFQQQWGWPIALAILTMFGLLAALIGQRGIWWALSWISLVLPLVVIAWHWIRSTGKKGLRDARRHSS